GGWRWGVRYGTPFGAASAREHGKSPERHVPAASTDGTWRTGTTGRRRSTATDSVSPTYARELAITGTNRLKQLQPGIGRTLDASSERRYRPETIVRSRPRSLASCFGSIAAIASGK